ncbi:28S ribosomal protein S23, mitochondrial [Notolabrus celidotus]|uniref:28S ribosomal protein S23, mitochondrial n=1 Tax=Notolabrus celidotus TaxID=1203425 RepID=UPI0014904717|nr:28S ribosomal protein S23, mitochondrial [Notolabrus celidotus]
MAGSRLERFGTVFTRVRDLMRSGVIKPSEKPVWFDVYRAFPPKREPLHVKPQLRSWSKKQEAVPEIFYREDQVRAKFYELYVPGRPFDLCRSSFVSTCQRFVEKHSELQSRGEVQDSTLFEETGKALLADGIMLRRRGDPPVPSESRDPVLGLRLTEMLAEQQTAPGGEETTQHSTHTDTDTLTHAHTPQT